MFAIIPSFLVFYSCAVNYGTFAISSNYFCADMSPQQWITIEQLMGMWYGMEIIPHNPEEQHYIRQEPSCPIIHISEDKSHFNTYSNLYKGYDYGHNYGQQRDPNRNYGNNNYNNNRGSYNINSRNPNNHRDRNNNNFNKGHYQYGQDRTTYGTGQMSKGQYGSYNDWIRKYQESDMKHLRIWWDENGSGTEYRVRYNVSEPGFWISAGPQNGSELEPQYSHLAGTIQVIKAVNDHLVLTFCHQLPTRNLFTIILSRDIKLDAVDINGVHSQMNRKGLSTTSIKKVCNGTTGTSHRTIDAIIMTVISVILLVYASETMRVSL